MNSMMVLVEGKVLVFQEDFWGQKRNCITSERGKCSASPIPAPEHQLFRFS